MYVQDFFVSRNKPRELFDVVHKLTIEGDNTSSILIAKDLWSHLREHNGLEDVYHKYYDFRIYHGMKILLDLDFDSRMQGLRYHPGIENIVIFHLHFYLDVEVVLEKRIGCLPYSDEFVRVIIYEFRENEYGTTVFDSIHNAFNTVYRIKMKSE